MEGFQPTSRPRDRPSASAPASAHPQTGLVLVVVTGNGEVIRLLAGSWAMVWPATPPPHITAAFSAAAPQSAAAAASDRTTSATATADAPPPYTPATPSPKDEAGIEVKKEESEE
ncbi:MAG: hypothetical protein M1822_007824 [Bathelium mastoideum]|nr:MAG: hypothetical protein M1822_007824 [Bathelium mastoideum]